MGDSCAQGGKPGIKETGTPEGVPRTAAITHAAGIKKAPADVMGALLRLELHGFPHPVAELAATVGRVACRFLCCNPAPRAHLPKSKGGSHSSLSADEKIWCSPRADSNSGRTGNSTG